MSYYGDYRMIKQCLESYDCESDSIAMENLNRDLVDIAKDLNPQINNAVARYQAAYNAEKYDEAMSILNEIEGCVRTWKRRLSALPAESMSKTIIRTTVKITAILISIFVIAKTGRITSFFTRTLTSMGASNAMIGIGSVAGGIAVTQPAWSTIFKNVAKFLANRVSKDDRERYKDDPNHHNATYVAAQVNLDKWMEGVAILKSDLKKLQEEAKKNPESK